MLRSERSKTVPRLQIPERSEPDSLQALLWRGLWGPVNAQRAAWDTREHPASGPRMIPNTKQDTFAVRLIEMALLLPGVALREPWGRPDRRRLGPVWWSWDCWMGEWGPDVVILLSPTWNSVTDLFYGFCHCHKLPKHLFPYIIL